MRLGEHAPLLLTVLVALGACAAPRPATVPISGGPPGTTALEVRLAREAERPQGHDRRLAAASAPATYRISVRAADMATPAVATASADPAPAALRLSGVPSGTNRLVAVTGLDAAGTGVPGAAWAGVVSLSGSVSSVTLTPATGAVGRVWERWLDAGKSLLAAQTSPSDVAGRLEAIRAAARLPHFAFVNAAAWADAAAAAGSLDPAGNFAIAPATADLTVEGAPEDVPADLWLDDPVSPLQPGVSPLTSQTNGRYLVAPVLPGTWSARVTVPGLGTATASVVVAAGSVATASLRFAGWGTGPVLPAGIGNAAVVSDGTSIFSLGGVTASGVATNGCWVLDTSAPTPAWAPLPNITRAREASMAAILGGKLYVVGGLASGTGNWEVYSLDLASRTAWTAEPSVTGAPATTGIGCCITLPVAPTGLFVRGGKLYVLYNTGGQAKPPYLAGVARAFDPANTGAGWATANDIPAIRTPRFNVGFAVLGSLAIVGGGDRASSFEGLANALDVPDLWQGVANVEALDLQTPAWAALPDLGGLRSEPALVAAGTQLFAAGGVDARQKALRTVERYSAATGAWRPVPPLRTARSSFGLAYAAGKVWAIGGAPARRLNAAVTSKAIVLDSVEWLDPGALPQ
ncbi:MAG: hypothetical protein FJZ01_19045 [Candidatus Sericytochromatia bacterium]|nr:hypothetical protein [Candidatus Tanganyikabacteria bacterium]